MSTTPTTPPEAPRPAAPERSLRRRIVGALAFALGIAWLAHSNCQGEAAQQVELALTFGGQPVPWREVRVDILRGDELMAWATQSIPSDANRREISIHASLPPGDYAFALVGTTADGKTVQQTRRGTIGEGTRLTIDLGVP